MSTDDLPRLSLDAMIQEVEAAITQWRSPSRGVRRPEVDLHIKRLEQTAATLRWLRRREAEFRAYAALPEHLRDVVRTHGPFVAELAMQIKRKEAIARAGGPKR